MSIIITTECSTPAICTRDCVLYETKADIVKIYEMATRVDIQGNVAKPGATQINNVNLTRCMFDLEPKTC